MRFLNNLFSPKTEIDFKELVNNGAVIVDVRTPAEFNSGHIAGSLNIELENINASIKTLKEKNKPVITVCRLGGRSNITVIILKAFGLEAYNGGAWEELQKKIE